MSLKYFKRSDSYQNSTGTLRINKDKVAYSYVWYKLGMLLSDGTYLINNFNYSSTTIKHYYKLVRHVRDKVSTNIVFIEAPKGLNNLNQALEYNHNKFMRIKTELANPRKRQITKDRLRTELVELESKIKLIERLINEEV